MTDVAYARCPAGCQKCGAQCRKVAIHPGNCDFHGRGKGGCPGKFPAGGARP